MQAECPFCSGEIRKRLIDQSDLSMVIVSNPGLVYGHLLIMPRRHAYSYSSLTPEEIIDLFGYLSKYQNRIVDKLSKGTEVRQSYVPYRPNNETHVNHFHFNLMPRDDNDEMAQKVDPYRRQLYKDVSDKEVLKIAKLLGNS